MILKVIFANSIDPDQTAPLLHTVCLYAKIGLKSLQEYSADDIKQTTFSDAGFLGILRVKLLFSHFCNDTVFCCNICPGAECSQLLITRSQVHIPLDAEFSS